PELRITLETGQKRRRSAFTFSKPASLASVVTSMTRRIFGNGTSISSSNCVPRRSKVDSASIVMALSSTPCFFAHLMGDDVGAGDQCSHHRFGWGRAHVCALALLGFIDDRLDVAYGNFCARMDRTVTPNTLRDGGFLFHGNHDVPPIVSPGPWSCASF